MRDTRIRCGAAALAAYALLHLPAAAVADVVERSFDTGATGTFELDADLGAVTVEAHASDRVEVRVQREGRDAQALQVEFERRGDLVRVTAELPDGWGDRRWGDQRLDVEFFVRLPRGFDVDVSTAAGSVRIDDLDGEVQVRTAGGSVSLANLGGRVSARTAGGSIDLLSSGGDVDLETAGGSISIERAGGEVEARTAGGSITVDDADGRVVARTAGGSIRIGRSGGDVEAHTSGGSIRIDDVAGAVDASTAGGSIDATLRSQPRGDSELSTQGGSVTVTLAPGIGLDVDARSRNSRVSSDFDFPASAFDDDRASLEGQLNGGGPRLSIRATDRIRLRRE